MKLKNGEYMPINDALFQEFCNHKNPGDLVGGDGWMDTADIFQYLNLLYALVKGYPVGPRILEIGTSDGTTTLAFLKALSERPPVFDLPVPKLVSVDAMECDAAIRSVAHFGYSHLWQFHNKTRSDEFFAQHARGHYDIILIDGDHSYEGTKRDFENALKFLEVDGIIMIHDAYLHRDHAEPATSKLIYEVLMDSRYSSFICPVVTQMMFVQRKEDVLQKLKDWWA